MQAAASVSPWLRPFIEKQAVETAWRSGLPLHEALNRVRLRPVQFVPQEHLPSDDAYEAFIHRTGTVPTRDNLHDFFNGLVWLAFPETKRRLNQLQAAEIARMGIASTRGALRDALTLFDENGALLDAPTALWEALEARDWHTLFVTHRPRWSEARLIVFGHALLEKLAVPRKAHTAHVLLPPTASQDARRMPLDDQSLSRSLTAEYLAQKPFVPLPVLGVPGWWAANAAPNFYDDPKVFRPRP